MPTFRPLALCLSVLLALAAPARPQGEGGATLPFDPARISRLSLDGIPRSLAIRQDGGIWLGYDLEGARVFKVWRAPQGKAGLAVSGFTTKSVGETLFSDKEAQGWRWRRADGTKTPRVRYLGCTDETGRFVLLWELRDGDDAVVLHERVATAAGRARRDLRVEGLGEGEALLPPKGMAAAWEASASPLRGAGWHRFALKE